MQRHYDESGSGESWWRSPWGNSARSAWEETAEADDQCSTWEIQEPSSVVDEAVSELSELSQGAITCGAESSEAPAELAVEHAEQAMEQSLEQVALGRRASMTGEWNEPAEARPAEGPPEPATLVGSDIQLWIETLERERPQVIAAMLAQMPPADAAVVLDGMCDDLQSEVLRRIGLLGDVDVQTRQLMCEAIAESLEHRRRQHARRAQGEAAVTAILNARADTNE